MPITKMASVKRVTFVLSDRHWKIAPKVVWCLRVVVVICRSLCFDKLRGSFSVMVFIVPLGDWEKKPRLQAKTLVCLLYWELLKSNRTFYDIRDQNVTITKNSKPILKADIAQRVLRLPRKNCNCRANNVEISERVIFRDHIHTRGRSLVGFSRCSSYRL